MLNWAIRYRPIIQEIHRLNPEWVLDIGSGPEGLRMFWHGKVIGLSLDFKRHPIHLAIGADANAIPIMDRSCPLVVSVDLLEHITPEKRRKAVTEMARVAKNHLLLVFPSGDAAEQIYRVITGHYRLISPPEWLQDHNNYRLTEVHHVKSWLNNLGWKTDITWFDSAKFHEKLLYFELRLGGKFLTYCLMRLMGPLLINHLPAYNQDPKMRVIMKCSRAA
jgi:hypothetical protein